MKKIKANARKVIKPVSVDFKMTFINLSKHILAVYAMLSDKAEQSNSEAIFKVSNWRLGCTNTTCTNTSVSLRFIQLPVPFTIHA